MDPYAIRPIPRICPIPPGQPALIGRKIQANPIYVLWKDGRQITIQAHTTSEHPILSFDPFGLEARDSISLLEQMYATYLEKIRVCLVDQDIDSFFESTSTCTYLLKRQTGHYHIYVRPDRLPVLKEIRHPGWGTLIREEEITFTVWGPYSDRRGYWNGLPVDIIYAPNDEEMGALKRAIYGWKAVQGLDVTFEVYGLLIGARNGKIIGLVCEAATGRMATPRDRGLVYDAIAQVQKVGCIYRGCLDNQFFISSGNKVRLVSLNLIKPYAKRDMLESDAERWHWQQLDRLFEELERFGPYGKDNLRLPLPRFTADARNITILFTLPNLSSTGSRLQLHLSISASASRETEYEDQPLTRRELHRRRTRLMEHNGNEMTSMRTPSLAPYHRLRLVHGPYRRRLLPTAKPSKMSTTEDTNSAIIPYQNDF